MPKLPDDENKRFRWLFNIVRHSLSFDYTEKSLFNFDTYIVSGEAALSSAGKSNVGSSCIDLAACVKFESNVTTLNKISSLTDSSKWWISFRGAWGKTKAKKKQNVAYHSQVYK